MEVAENIYLPIFWTWQIGLGSGIDWEGFFSLAYFWELPNDREAYAVALMWKF